MDWIGKEKRSALMSRIRSKDTKPELALRRALRAAGLGYRKNWKALPGSPDVALTKWKIAVFVDGRFWHAYGWDGFPEGERRKYASLREQVDAGANPEFWTRKLTRNAERDREVDAELKGLGWTVIRFTDAEALKDPEGCARAVLEAVEAARTELDDF